MTSRYANASQVAGKTTAPAAAAPLTPGKATLAERLVVRGLTREEVLAMIEAATRGGSAAPTAVAARSTYGNQLVVHRGPAADDLTEAAGQPVVVADEHVVVAASIDPAAPVGTAAIADAITAAPAGQMTAKLSVPGEGDGKAGRPTPPWPSGPMTNYKANQQVPIADYIAWVRAFENAYGVGGDSVQRMRRLHYSAPTLGAGPLFDQLLATGSDTMPTSPPLAQATLDQLYATGAVLTPQGQTVDLSHVFVMFDLSISGTSLAGTVANQITPLAGLFTWTGDLGSWFQAWLAGRAWLREGSGEVGGEAPGEGAGEGGGEGGEGGGEGGGEAGEGEGDRMRGIFDSPRNDETWTKQLERLDAAKDRCKKDDLLGNMDAHALAGAAPQVAAGTQSMAAILDQYYGAGAATGVDRRFHRFVASAVPAIPFVLVNASPLTVQLGSSAQQAIYDILFNAVRSLRKAPIDPLEGHAAILQVIASRFTQFLRTGLATGDAPW